MFLGAPVGRSLATYYALNLRTLRGIKRSILSLPLVFLIAAMFLTNFSGIMSASCDDTKLSLMCFGNHRFEGLLCPKYVMLDRYPTHFWPGDLEETQSPWGTHAVLSPHFLGSVTKIYLQEKKVIILVY